MAIEVEIVEGWHWRDSQRPARFFNIDARAGAAWLLFVVHIRVYTLIMALLLSAAFWMLERRGMSLPAALRAFRRWLIGDHRPGVVWTSRRKFVDNGSL